MKAALFKRYGSPDVIEITEVPKPVPKDDEVLIRVHAAGLNPLDWRILKGEPAMMRMMFGWPQPKDPRIGRDVSGVVEAVGAKVTRFQPGEEVFGACRGAAAEYASAVESKVVPKSKNITFEQAASLPIAGLTSLQALRGRVEAGQKVLVNGAAGGTGTFAVQIAKYYGASVTGVCATDKVDMVRSIGAESVIDYTREDFTKLPARYDLVLDCVATRTLEELRSVLKPKGKCVRVGAPHDFSLLGFLGDQARAGLMSWFGSRKFITLLARVNAQDLTLLGDLVASGKMTPVIGRQYPLQDVPDALRYLENGHARGKVTIVM